MSLDQKKCEPCRTSGPTLPKEEQSVLQKHLNKEWEIVEGHHLKREFVFPDFKLALAFTNQIGEISEEEGHHPNIELTWGQVIVSIWTHKRDGLMEADFILAAKFDKVFAGN
tara:strand:- start:456 stop:791 length:336 start_codon:yes stop_codon:yes gene_type:complete